MLASDQIEGALRGWVSGILGFPADIGKLGTAIGTAGAGFANPRLKPILGQVSAGTEKINDVPGLPGDFQYWNEAIKKTGLDGGGAMSELAGALLPVPGLGPVSGGIIAGRKALTAPKKALDQADDEYLNWMQNKSYSDVINKGPNLQFSDGLWDSSRTAITPQGYSSFEIPTRYGELLQGPRAQDFASGDLDKRGFKAVDVLGKDSELLQAYPSLGRYILANKPSVEGGAMGAHYRNGVIDLAPHPDVRALESTLNHELQHGVQQLEGWQSGASPRSWFDEGQETLLENARGVKSKIPDEMYEALLKEQKAAFDKYNRTFGEVQARNVQARLGLSRNTLKSPARTDDIPWGLQIDPYR